MYGVSMTHRSQMRGKIRGSCINKLPWCSNLTLNNARARPQWPIFHLGKVNYLYYLKNSFFQAHKLLHIHTRFFLITLPQDFTWMHSCYSHTLFSFHLLSSKQRLEYKRVCFIFFWETGSNLWLEIYICRLVLSTFSI